MNVLVPVIFGIFKWMPLWLLRASARGLGRILWYADIKSVKVSRKNIALCFPELTQEQQKSLTKAATLELVITAFEVFKVWSMQAEKLSSKIVAVNNESLYLEAIANNKPIMLVGPHLGNWEVAGLYTSTKAAMTTMFAPIKYEAINTLVKNSRAANGASLVPTNVRGVMAMVKALRKKGQVGILPDQKADQGSGLHSSFFGNMAYTMTLVNTLQKKTDAVVIMTFAERVKSGWKVHFQAPDPAIYNTDLQTSVDGLNRSVERCVQTCPAQYQWEYKRFSGQPDGSDPYANLDD